MDRVANIMNGLGRNWVSGFWVFLVAYFAFHAFQGDNSIYALKNLQAQEVELQALADYTRQRRQFLELKTSALSRRSVDPDMLEEQVRKKLGFAHQDEVIIMLQ